MQFQSFVSFAFSSGISSLGIFALVALLACLLGAEIACICILIVKMARAKRAKEDEEFDDGYQSLHGGAIVALSAIPSIAYASLSGLAIACAVAALVLVLLMIIARAKGYHFATVSRTLEAPKEELIVTPPVEEAPVVEENAEEVPLYEDCTSADDEAQLQEAYTEVNEEDAFAVFSEDATEEDSAPEEAEEGELLQPIREEQAPVPVQMPAATEAPAGPMFADGTQPYKVVEKVVTETYKEVIKEAPPAPEQSNPSVNTLLERVSDLLEYELQKRKADDAAAESEDEVEESVPTMARTSTFDAEDAEEDEDEDSEEDSRDEDDEEVVDDEGDEDGDRFTGNERIIGFDEETGCYIVAHYRKSFEAKLIQARPNIKEYYSELKNALLSYKGSKNRISWSADSFHNGRQPIAKINVKTRILEIYLALDPATLEGTVYRGKDVGSKKKYAETPFQYKVRTPRKFKWAMELVQRTCEEHGLSPIDIDKVDYVAEYPFDTTENLVARNLIKEYIRQEKPATSFELAPDHVPVMPEEDGSVIPANANFSWEFDNERMSEAEEVEEIPAEEPVEEPIEEVIEEAPVVEEAPAPAPEATVVRETVKVTEMRYTERYYANAEPTFEQVITTTEPIEVATIEAPAAELEEEPVEEASAVEDNEDALFAEEIEEVEEADAPEAVEEGDEEFFFSEEAEEAFPAEEEALEEEPVEEEQFFSDADEELVFPEDVTEEEAYEEDSYEEEAEEAQTEEALEEEIEYEEIEEEEEPVVQVPVSNPAVALVDICSVEAYYAEGETVSLESLKEKGLVLLSAETLKVYASGSLSKKLNVEANHFTMDAIIAISGVDGESAMIR